MSAKHTQGPWQARTFLVRGGANLSDTICHVGSSTSLPPSRSNESEANARLIAAAPDLLEALSPFAALMVPASPKQGNAGFYSIRFDDIARAHAAIAKAFASPNDDNSDSQGDGTHPNQMGPWS